MIPEVLASVGGVALVLGGHALKVVFMVAYWVTNASILLGVLIPFVGLPYGIYLGLRGRGVAK